MYSTRWRTSSASPFLPINATALLALFQNVQYPIFQPDSFEGVRSVSDGLSPSSVAKLRTVVHNMLRKAVRWGRVSRNVSEDVDPPTPVKREKVMLSPEQVRRFLQAARGHRLEAPFVLAVTTGARSGELLGLTWGNVDLDQVSSTSGEAFTRARAGSCSVTRRQDDRTDLWPSHP